MSTRTLRIGDTIALKSYHGKYLVAEKDGRLRAARTKLGDWERFVVLDAGGGNAPRDVKFGEAISLFSQHCRYVVAEPGGGAHAVRDNAGHWEQWKIIDPDNPRSRVPVSYDGKIALLSFHDSYLVAEKDGKCNADRKDLGDWEKWELLEGNRLPENAFCLGDRIGLKSFHDTFLVAKETGKLNADSGVFRAWERFTVHAADGTSAARHLKYGDTVCLYTHHKSYVGAEPDGKAYAARSSIGIYEKWVLVEPSNSASTGYIYYNDKVALRACNDNYLVAESDGNANANRPHLGQWEQWKIKTTKRYLLSSEVKQTLEDQLAGKFSGGYKLYFADAEYYCPTPSDAYAVIKRTSVEQMNYISERFDCDDFAHLLKAEFIKDGYHNGVRRSPHCFGIIWNGSHAFNWMINDDKQVRFIEPQNDKISYPAAEAGIYYVIA